MKVFYLYILVGAITMAVSVACKAIVAAKDDKVYKELADRIKIATIIKAGLLWPILVIELIKSHKK